MTAETEPGAVMRHRKVSDVVSMIVGMLFFSAVLFILVKITTSIALKRNSRREPTSGILSGVCSVSKLLTRMVNPFRGDKCSVSKSKCSNPPLNWYVHNDS